MNRKIVPISLIASLTLLHILPHLFRPLNHPFFRTGFLFYTLIFLCLWGLLLWYSVKTESKGLVRLYQLFWLLMAMLGLYASLAMFIVFATDFPFIWFMALPLLFEPPLNGFRMFGMSEFMTFFILPLLMFLLGVVAKWKFIK